MSSPGRGPLIAKVDVGVVAGEHVVVCVAPPSGCWARLGVHAVVVVGNSVATSATAARVPCMVVLLNDAHHYLLTPTLVAVVESAWGAVWDCSRSASPGRSSDPPCWSPGRLRAAPQAHLRRDHRGPGTSASGRGDRGPRRRTGRGVAGQPFRYRDRVPEPRLRLRRGRRCRRTALPAICVSGEAACYSDRGRACRPPAPVEARVVSRTARLRVAPVAISAAGCAGQFGNAPPCPAFLEPIARVTEDRPNLVS